MVYAMEVFKTRKYCILFDFIIEHRREIIFFLWSHLFDFFSLVHEALNVALMMAIVSA